MNESSSQQESFWQKEITTTEEELREAHGGRFMSRGSDYVCSRDLYQRIVAGNMLSARIKGRRGTYNTVVRIEGVDISAECDCPSDRRICRHAVALILTYLRDGKSFSDLGKMAKELRSRSVDELIDIIVDIAMREPTILGSMGSKGLGSFD